MQLESSCACRSRAGHLPRPAKVSHIVVENYRTRSLVLDIDLAAQAGQFVMVWLPGLGEKPYSLTGAHPVTLTVCDVGPFSHALHGLEPGDRLGIRGPFGQGFTAQGKRALLAGGGYGVAPLVFLAETLRGQGMQVTVAIGARTAVDVLLGERFERLGVSPCVATEDGSAGTPGRITALVAPLLQSGAVDALYACGPHAMLEALAGLCRQTRVPGQLSWEAYMRCGMGLCGSCEHEGQLVCTDGPVLAVALAAEDGQAW